MTDAAIAGPTACAGVARVTLEACYVAHRAMVFQRCLRYAAGNVTFAEEITQDAFIKLAEQFDRLRDLDDLGGWLHRVAANLAISRLRRERSLLAKLQAIWSTADRHDPETARGMLERRETADRVLDALRALPPRERVAICMKLIEGASQREIARSLGLSEGYVSKLLQRGLARLAAAGWEVSDVET